MRAFTFATVLLLPALACAEVVYPSRPLRLIVPFPPGGGNDLLARALAQRLTEPLKQQVIVDNRGGAGGMLGGQIAAGADPDGHTLLLGSMGSLAHNPALRANNPYFPPRDFAAVAMLATSPFLLVAHPSAPAGVKELIAVARAKPNALNFGSAGAGSSLHLTGELFNHMAGVKIMHIAYKGTAPAITELIAGQVHIVFSTMAPSLPHVKTGKLRALGVTSLKRAKVVADVPAIAEAGLPGFEVENWQGVVAPAKTPTAIITLLHGHISRLLAAPEMQSALNVQGLDVLTLTSQAFNEFIAREIAKWRKVVQAANIKID
jgi:tripartite-type tricarboxylate transporter receptor subunit TctC